MSIEQELTAYLVRASEARGKPLARIDPNAAFMESGMLDSLLLLDFIVFLEKHYRIKIPGEEIVPENFGTLAATSEYLRRRIVRGERS